jgi:type IV secretory pathway VirB2 component (pilin)
VRSNSGTRAAEPAALGGRSTSTSDGRVNASLGSTPRASPPPLALAALYLLGAEFALATVRSILMKDWSHPAAATLWVVALVVMCFFWWYALWRRVKWVWWATVILGVVGCALAPVSVSILHRPLHVALYWLQFALTAASVGLLLLPSPRHWYLHRAHV